METPIREKCCNSKSEPSVKQPLQTTRNKSNRDTLRSKDKNPKLPGTVTGRDGSGRKWPAHSKEVPNLWRLRGDMAGPKPMKSHTNGSNPRYARECSDKEKPKLASHMTGTCDMRCPETVSSSTPILLMARSSNVAPEAAKLEVSKGNPIQPRLCNKSMEPVSLTPAASGASPKQALLQMDDVRSSLANCCKSIGNPRFAVGTEGDKPDQEKLCNEMRKSTNAKCSKKAGVPRQAFPSTDSNSSDLQCVCDDRKASAWDIDAGSSDKPAQLELCTGSKRAT